MADPNPYMDAPDAPPSGRSVQPASLATTDTSNPYMAAPDADNSWAKTGGDVANQGAIGFNQGVASLASMPGDITAWAAKKLGASEETADRFRAHNLSKYVPQGVTDVVNHWLGNDPGQEAQTDAGRYANSVGQMVGSSIIPEASFIKYAPELATMQRATAPTLRAAAKNAVIETAGNVASAPGTAAALSLASSTGSGLARQAAEDEGFGPTGQMLASLAGGAAPAAFTSTMPSMTLARQRAQETAADLAAHNDLGVRPFGPAFSSPPAQTVGKHLSEAFFGAPLRNALDESLEGSRDAMQTIADRMGGAADHNDVGKALQNGLDRYRNAGIQALDPQDLNNVGIAQTGYQAPPNRLMTKDAAARASQADAIRAQQGVPLQPISPMTMMRRGAEDMSDQELGNIIAAPSANTSFKAKAEALYERADRALPDLTKSNGSVDPGMLKAVNTRQVVSQLQGQIANDFGCSALPNDSLVSRLTNSKSNFGLDDLRAIRTEVGRRLGGFGATSDASLDRSQLRQLYGALSKDIEVGTMDLANRARINSNLPPSDPKYVPQAVADQAQRALPMLKRADTYFSAGQDRLDNVMKTLGASDPEQASRTVANAALGQGKGNLNLLQSARAALRPEEWNQFAALVLRNLGAPVGSARGTAQELGFSVNSFMTRWNNMNPTARNLLFGGEHAKDIDNLVRVINRQANVEAAANTSKTAVNSMNVGAAVDAATMLATGHPEAIAAQLGGGYGLSYLMSRPAYAKWATRYAALRSNVAQKGFVRNPALLGQINALGNMTRLDPMLKPIYDHVKEDNGL